MSVTMEDIRTYGFAEAIRQHFRRRAEAKKPPLTEHQRIRKAIEEICRYSYAKGPVPYRVGLFEVSDRSEFYDGEQSTRYQMVYQDTLIWEGTSYGYFNPSYGYWKLEGPWQDTALAVLEARAVTLKAQHDEERAARLIREKEEEEARILAAEEKRQRLIALFAAEQQIEEVMQACATGE